MRDPYKDQLKHVALTTLQLHVMSRNVPRPLSLQADIVHQSTSRAFKQVVIRCKFTRKGEAVSSWKTWHFRLFF